MSRGNNIPSQERDLRQLLPYVTDLELEVDRLRRHNQVLYQEAWAGLKRIQELGAAAAATNKDSALPAEIGQAVKHLDEALQDLREPPGYHPSHDQVVAIAVRPVAEQVFRWQQRLLGVREATLQLELESEYVEWFPARLRHILDNLLSNALKYRDPAKAQTWVRLGLRVCPEAYEFRVSDNGVGLPTGIDEEVFELLYRAAPVRAAGLRVGLAVVKLLVEQSGGSLTAESAAGEGTTFIVTLPCYAVDDFLI